MRSLSHAAHNKWLLGCVLLETPKPIIELSFWDQHQSNKFEVEKYSEDGPQFFFGRHPVRFLSHSLSLAQSLTCSTVVMAVSAHTTHTCREVPAAQEHPLTQKLKNNASEVEWCCALAELYENCLLTANQDTVPQKPNTFNCSLANYTFRKSRSQLQQTTCRAPTHKESEGRPQSNSGTLV